MAAASAVQAPQSAPKLLSLLNSTLSSAHELGRSLTHVQHPSPTLLRTVKRNLTTLAVGITKLQDDQESLEQDGRRGKVSLEEVRQREDELVEVNGAWKRLCDMLTKHVKTSELLNDVRGSHPRLFRSGSEDASSIIVAHRSSTPYHDSPHKSKEASFSRENELDNNVGNNSDLLQSQSIQMATQDQHLDSLSLSIGRQHHLSVQMNEELAQQATLLDEMDRDVENTSVHLGRASRRLDKFTRSLKEHGSTWTILALIILLVLLIALFK